jgi:hypothetical protein
VSHIIVVTTRSPQVEVGDVGKSAPELGCRLEWYSSSPQAWSVVILRVGLLVEEYKPSPLVMLVTALLRRRWSWHDVKAESTWSWRNVIVDPCLWWHCWVLLAIKLLSQHWPWHIVTVEPCWWRHYWVLLMMTLPSRHWSWRDVTAEVTWLWHDVTTESC